MSRRSLAPILFALAIGSSWPLPAQSGPCNFGNARNTCITQLGASVTDAVETGDRFGAALAAGDFDGDGLRELVVGAPGENADAGAIFVFERKGVGWKQKGGTILESSVGGQAAAAGNGFGRALASGDFDSDQYDDLAIGAPGRAFVLGGGSNCGADQICNDAGRVYVLWGGPSGLDLTAPTVLDPAQPAFGSGLSDSENFGLALAAGAIDGTSGPRDLAIGVPGRKVDGLASAGGIRLLFGDELAPLTDGIELFRSDPEANERFGQILEVGDPEGSFYRLSVGSPFDDIDGTFVDVDGGSVVLGFNSAGLASGGIGVGAFGENLQDDDRSGHSLAIADFDGDGSSDVAFGAPLRDVGGIGIDNSGQLFVAYGGAQPIGSNETDIFEEESWGATSQDNDSLGLALQGGDLDGDTRTDLLVSVHRKGANDTGYVYLLWGSASGLVTSPSKGLLFSQAFLGGTNDDDDLFSYVLLTANFDPPNATGNRTEIVLGVPDKNVGAIADAGMVYVTRAFDVTWVFADGFESASTTNWSATID